MKEKKLRLEDALWRGTLMLILLPMLTFNCAIWPALILANKGLIPGWSIGIAILAGFAGSWLVWSLLVTRWKLWAFSRVDDIKELKERAVAAKLIWKDDSIFTKTEIATKAQKAKLQTLEKRH